MFGRKPPSDKQLFQELISLNPWSRNLVSASTGLGDQLDGPEFLRARQSATTDRLAIGHRTWNNWAREMLACRPENGSNADSIKLWRSLATADFTGKKSFGEIDCAGLIFPGPVIFDEIVIGNGCYFSGAQFLDTASFRQTHFLGDAYFEMSIHSASSCFDGAIFERSAQFRRTEFGGAFSAVAARFLRDSWFRDSSFNGSVNFDDTVFYGDCSLGSCSFKGPASFRNTQYHDTTSLDRSVFNAGLDLSGSEFHRRLFLNHAEFHGFLRLDGIILHDEVRLEDVQDRSEKGGIDLIRSLLLRGRS